ncbi:MAG: DUF885 domain-containing protein [Chitinophagaceae bacterium]|nr:DUF885 domain-containing protein [Chitinophagaceae bacterium]
MKATKYIFTLLFSAAVLLFAACNNGTNNSTAANADLAKLFSAYWEENLQLYPFQATAIGDNRYNDQFPNNQTDSFRKKEMAFIDKYLAELQKINANSLNNASDKESYDLLAYELNINKEGLQLPFYKMPINQFWSFTLEFPQLGSGSGNQPFKSVADYENFSKRMKLFPAWVDSAISNMRSGIQSKYVLPKALVEKIIPQIKSVLTIDPTANIFYTPIKNMPDSFSAVNKEKLKNMYFFNISNSIIPAYSKLRTFMEKEYLPASRSTSGIGALPEGSKMYNYLIHLYTTTNLTADSVYNLGLQQVASLRAEMEKVKTEVGYTGTLEAFFTSLNNDATFQPFKTPKQILDSFWSCKKTIDPKLATMFLHTPTTKFEIRQTEAFRQASASAEYNAGSEDGTRPGVFYVPIIDALKFNAIGMETLFLHEAIPGHHYQISLQQENKSLPQFRKFIDYSAYAEGWALYTETLGKELGLYKNPYQYLGHLSDAMHRAIRLVVDAGLHSKGMSREEAITYMMANERITKDEATAEIERYMAIPGQALSYMVGKITILRMRAKYEKQLGAKFSLAEFHDQLLNGGNMPLGLLEKKLERWSGK